MAVYQTRLTSILSKVEATEGADSTPGASDGFFATVGQLPNPAQFLENTNKGGKGSQLAGVIGPRAWQGIPVSVNLRGSGAAYSASVKPKCDQLLRMGGFQATGSFTGGSEKWTYIFRSDAGTFESFSNYLYRAGKNFKLLGARAIPTLTFAVGGFGRLDAPISAWYTPPVDAALVAVTGEPTVTYPVLLASGFQIGTENFAAKHGDITIDCGRKIIPRGDGTAVTGYAGMEMVGDRTPKITFECEQTTEAGYPFWTKLLAGTQMDCTFSLGATQYNKCDVSIPAMQFESLGEGDRNGIATYKAVSRIVSPTGVDDDISIVFN